MGFAIAEHRSSQRYAASRRPPPSSRSQWSARRSSWRLRSSLTPSAAPITACVCASPPMPKRRTKTSRCRGGMTPEHRPDLAASLPLVEPTPWVLGILVGEEVDQRGALLVHRVEGRRDASRLAHRPDRSHRQAGARGDRLGARRSRELAAQLLLRPLDRGERASGSRGDADGPLALYGVRHRAPDPPDREGRELRAAAVIEAVDGANQTDGPLLHQVLERDAQPTVSAREEAYQPQVRRDHLLPRAAVAALDGQAQPDFVGRREDAGHLTGRERGPGRAFAAARPARLTSPPR